MGTGLGMLLIFMGYYWGSTYTPEYPDETTDLAAIYASIEACTMIISGFIFICTDKIINAIESTK